MNPIVKVTIRNTQQMAHLARPRRRGEPGAQEIEAKTWVTRRWAFICPICPDRLPQTALMLDLYAGVGNTRKCAKDALHRHMREVHAALC